MILNPKVLLEEKYRKNSYLQNVKLKIMYRNREKFI